MKLALPLLALTVLLSGCASSPSEHHDSDTTVAYASFMSLGDPVPSYAQLSKIVGWAGNDLANQMRSQGYGTSRLLVTSFTDLQSVDKTNKCGRLVAENLTNRLHMLGLQIVEARLGRSLVMQDGQGEMLLSRNPELAQHDVQSHFVVTGTYAQTQEGFAFNVRIIDPTTRSVLASTTFVLPVEPARYGR
jgi:TolB-like protein